MTITVLRDGRYAGSGSKQTTINYSGTSTIMQVQQTFDWDSQNNKWVGDWAHSALIENLVIDGLNYSGTTGILLENVVNCFIRNLTIRNCDVGIHLRNTDIHSTGGLWTEFNRIEHVRMSNVKQGILFSTTTGGGDSFGFTKIDDVGIELKNDSSAVGIQIGDGTSLVKPYSSFIKANVWIQSAGGTGMKLNNAELRYGLINFAVQGPSNGIGVDLQSNPTRDRAIWYNQFSTFTGSPPNDTVDKKGFLLATGGISYTPPDDRRILPNNALTDILTKSW
jgi:parallel beta-helix repeat protein